MPLPQGKQWHFFNGGTGLRLWGGSHGCSPVSNFFLSPVYNKRKKMYNANIEIHYIKKE